MSRQEPKEPVGPGLGCLAWVAIAALLMGSCGLIEFGLEVLHTAPLPLRLLGLVGVFVGFKGLGWLWRTGLDLATRREAYREQAAEARTAIVAAKAERRRLEEALAAHRPLVQGRVSLAAPDPEAGRLSLADPDPEAGRLSMPPGGDDPTSR